MWEWAKTGSEFLRNNSDSLSGIGAIIGGVGNAVAAYKQNKLARQNYNLNLDILKEERRRRNQSQQNLENAWASSAFLNNNQLFNERENKNGF